LDVALLLNFDFVVSAIVVDNILHFRPIKNFCLMMCDAVYSGTHLTVFQRSLLPASSR
jgi:hypothetical protein